MLSSRKALVYTTLAAGLGLASAAFAANPAGFYLGAGVGESDLRGDGYGNGYTDYTGYHDRQTAWKLIAGVRPIAPLGVELEYLDFGSVNRNSNYYYGGNYFNGYDSDAKAGVLFGVGYLPLPLPFLDVYGKAGVARLESRVTNSSNQCAPPLECVPPAASRSTNWTSNFAYGVGVQTKWFGLAVRAEYERISASGGDPDALTVSATWTF
jgi:hypothetical protein